MILRADHVAAGAFVVFGVAVFAISGDLPFGSLSMPGAGMMPKLMAGLLILFAIMTFAGGRESRPFAEIEWSNLTHALLLVAITAVAVSLYTLLGFLLTMSLLVFALLTIVERRNPLYAAAYAIGLTLFAYWLFGKALKAPLERGILGF